jgi:hypothetical protein
MSISSEASLSHGSIRDQRVASTATDDRNVRALPSSCTFPYLFSRPVA